MVDRVQMTVSCNDCGPLPKVVNAGMIEDYRGSRVQIMHNGIKVIAGGYHGDWMQQIIRDLRGHHEPQEELLFRFLLSHCRPNTTFVELGAFWSYYTLWYLAAVQGAKGICVEPDPNSLDIGRKNVRLNDFEDRVRFIHACVGETYAPAVEFPTETAGLVTLPVLDMDAVCQLTGPEEGIEVLHIDAQGAEEGFLRSMRSATAAGKVRFLVASTHHHSISGSKTTHTECLSEVERQGGTILAEHSVEASYSGDGLIIASFSADDRGILLPEISRNTPEMSLFGASS